VIRRAEIKPGVTNIATILKKYATGNADVYGNTVARDSGLSMYEDIDLWRDPKGYLKLYDVMIAMSKWEAGARSSSAPGYEAYHLVYNLSDQAVVDELYWGLVHGLREGWRDQGYTIEVTPEEVFIYEAPEAPVEEDEVEQSDPLINGVSGWRTVISGSLGILATFFTAVFDIFGFENAEKLGSVTAQVFIGLALVFLILKFWKRFERIIKRGVKSVG
jgi:hypothetical protein